MNTTTLLLTLERQIATLETEIAPIGHLSARQARFDPHLFHCHGTRLHDYMQELKHNLIQLQSGVQKCHLAQVTFLAEKVVAQISALQRELATQTLRKRYGDRAPAHNTLYSKLVQHQDYERRLLAMIQDRESLLGQQSLLHEQQQMQREIAALEGRLSRCRAALSRLEHLIERQEKYF